MSTYCRYDGRPNFPHKRRKEKKRVKLSLWAGNSDLFLDPFKIYAMLPINTRED